MIKHLLIIMQYSLINSIKATIILIKSIYFSWIHFYSPSYADVVFVHLSVVLMIAIIPIYKPNFSLIWHGVICYQYLPYP